MLRIGDYLRLYSCRYLDREVLTRPSRRELTPFCRFTFAALNVLFWLHLQHRAVDAAEPHVQLDSTGGSGGFVPKGLWQGFNYCFSEARNLDSLRPRFLVPR